MFTYNRISLDLNGIWKFCPDPMQRCRQQAWWCNRSSNTSFFPCWDIEGLWDIQVPGTWKKQFLELNWYDGHAVYVRDFQIPDAPEDHEAFLVFDSVCYTSEVYLNGLHVCTHDWGYSPFVCRVTDLLRVENRMFVLVENKLSPDRVPGVRFDWNNDGGILSGVKLIFVPRVYIENFRTSTRLDGDEVVIGIEVHLESRDRAAKTQVSVSIPELNIAAAFEVSVDFTGWVELRIPQSHITLWSPDTPKLYETVLATDSETITDHIGYREIKTQGRDVLLNGEAIRLYGVCAHSEFPDTGRTATPEGIQELIARVKELGCNFVRCAHYPYPEIFGRAMDEAGLLWWEEVPVYWLPGIQQEHMSRQALGMLQEMIVRDWNRGSLIIWSVSNECAGDGGASFDLKGDNYPYWVEACRLVRHLDPSRLISSADSGHRRTLHSHWTPDKADEFDQNGFHERWLPGHPDAFYDLLDILSGNVYVFNPGDGAAALSHFVAMLAPYNKPLMVSEFGSMSVLGSDDLPGVTPTKIGSEARHCKILTEAYTAFRELPQISGYMPWCLMDVRVPLHWRWYNSGKAVFRYGLMDENWNRKKAFEVVKQETHALRALFSEPALAEMHEQMTD